MELKCHTACSHASFLDVLKTPNPLYRWIKQSAYELKAIPADLLTSRLEGYSCLSKTFSNGWPQEHFSCPGGVKKTVCDLLPHQKLVTCRKLDSGSAVLFECLTPQPAEIWSFRLIISSLRQIYVCSNLSSESSRALEALHRGGSHEEQILMICYS